MELFALGRGYPPVFLAPKYEHGTLDLSVARLNLVGVTLVVLRDLTIEGVLAFSPQPGLKVRLHRFIVHRVIGGVPYVSCHHRPVHIRRNLPENPAVLLHESIEGRTPRRERHCINQSYSAEIST